MGFNFSGLLYSSPFRGQMYKKKREQQTRVCADCDPVCRIQSAAIERLSGKPFSVLMRFLFRGIIDLGKVNACVLFLSSAKVARRR